MEFFCPLFFQMERLTNPNMVIFKKCKLFKYSLSVIVPNTQIFLLMLEKQKVKTDLSNWVIVKKRPVLSTDVNCGSLVEIGELCQFIATENMVPKVLLVLKIFFLALIIQSLGDNKSKLCSKIIWILPKQWPFLFNFIVSPVRVISARRNFSTTGVAKIWPVEGFYPACGRSLGPTCPRHGEQPGPWCKGPACHYQAWGRVGTA